MKRLVPYPLRVELRRAARWVHCLAESPKPTVRHVGDASAYPYVLFSHSSKLVRHVAPELMPLQHNKIENLRLACERMDGLLLGPGDLFSFCRVIGRTSRLRGYREGLEMHRGELIGAPGGGLCQMANLIYWMALHLDMEVVERHHHEIDLFPDDERTVPFGMGASVFYNYIDLRLRNTLDQPLVLRVSVEPPLLCGEFRSDRELPFAVRIVETEHRFYRGGDGDVCRENRVAKEIAYRDGREPARTEIAHNVGRVCYDVSPELVSPAS